jgi:hypothetical protein
VKKILFIIILGILVSGVFGKVFFDNLTIDIIKLESSKLDLDYRFILAIADVESDFRWNVRGKSGEVGPFQIKKDTYMWLRNTVTKKYPQSTLKQHDFVYFFLTDTQLSKTIHIKSVCLFIRWLLDQEDGNLELSLQRYNGSYRKDEYAKEVLNEYEKYKKEF